MITMPETTSPCAVEVGDSAAQIRSLNHFSQILDMDRRAILEVATAMFSKSSIEVAYPRPRTMYSVPPKSSMRALDSVFPSRTASSPGRW